MGPVEAIYGPITIGIFLNLVLYGVMVTQTYFYLTRFKQDRMWMRAFVGVIFFSDTINTMFDAAFLYRRLVQDFGNVDKIMITDWVFNTDPAMTACIAWMVQLFFGWRIKLLTGSIFLTMVVAVCATVSFVMGIMTAIECGIVRPFVEFHKFKAVVVIWLAFAALADVIIAVVLCLHLRKQKTGFAFTNDLITRITRLTIQTGAATSIFAMLDLITFVCSTSGIHLAFNMPLAKLYTNSLLSTLNSRTRPSQSDQGCSNPGAGGRVSRRQETVDVKFAERSVHHANSSTFEINTQATEHELDDVHASPTNLKVYVNVEETVDVV